jgi:hypothetical protein
MIPLFLCWQVQYLILSSAKWHISYCVPSSPLFDLVLSQMTLSLLCSQQSTTWPCSDTCYCVQNSPLLDHILFIWYNCYSVHNSPPLDNILNQIIHLLLWSQQSTTWSCSDTCYCVQNSPQLDHVLTQMIHLLLCSQQPTTWPYSVLNDTSITVFTTVHYFTLCWGKWIGSISLPLFFQNPPIKISVTQELSSRSSTALF